MGPAAAEVPPLIPRAVLFGDPKQDLPQISPDGTRLAYVAPSPDGVVNLWVRTLGQKDERMVTHDTHRGIWSSFWAWDDRHLLYLQDSDGDENSHLYSSDLETGVVRDLTPFQGIRAQTILLHRAHPNQVLLGLNLRDRKVFDMYRVDLTTGAVLLEAQNPGDVLGWTTDANFVIRAATALDPQDGSTVIRVRDAADAPWRDLLRFPFEDTSLLGQLNGSSLVLGFTADGRTLYVVTSVGSNTTRLVKVDAATGQEQATLATDPRCDLWAAFEADNVPRFQVLLDPTTSDVQAVAFDYVMPEWKALDPKVQADFEVLKKLHAGVFFIPNRDRADAHWIVGFFTASGPTAYYLYDRTTRKADLVFEDRPELAKQGLPDSQPVTIRARDGLDLVCYLTTPLGVKRRKLPMVLLVHGGPWTRDEWAYSGWVQWLANRGYAVLQVNFRGSLGFGKKFLNAGNGQWGVGGMQNDLSDAVAWAVKRGLADPKRVAIMGGSYGGYATLAGLAFTPGLYACGVDVVGPSNVQTLFKSIPDYWKPVKKRWILRVGNVEGDDGLNQRISPLFHVDAIRAPLLIGHGANDPRVKIEESDTIVKALRDRNLPVTYIVYPDEGHGFARAENNMDFFGRVEEFLGKNLGGRVEPWKVVPGATAQVR